MAVRIRLMRLGKIRNPQYRIVVADSRKKRDGRAIEEIGLYHPKEDPSRIEVKSDRAQHWLSVGAQPSEPVQRILELTGDWQKFKGLPAPEPLKVAAPRADKHARYEAEAKAVAAPEEKPAAEKKKRPAKKATKSAKGEGADASADAGTSTKAGKDAAGEAGEDAGKDAAKKAAKKTDAKAANDGSTSEDKAGADASPGT